ncbi:hypothetical protein, partial [Roseovarius salinarum]|uniref:hypothetical protein n=1 Tax=Roseovarius salinarum TaxID=1981892 RepID=UPI001E605F14
MPRPDAPEIIRRTDGSIDTAACVDTPGFARISSSVRSRDRVHPCVRPCFGGIVAPLAGMVV